jgi:4-amino-4-deoxy-L-arabinose transferase-like glycosyltransferase
MTLKLPSERAAVAALFVLALGLQVVAVTGQSLIGDAAYHLLAGHQALRHGTNSLNLEHPPLVKMVAALPLLAEDEPATDEPPVRLDRVLEASHRLFDDSDVAGRVRIRSRLLVLLIFGVPFLAACYLLGREVADRATGVVLAATMAFSIPTLPSLAILQTDTAAALGFTLTLATALRYVKPGRQGPRAAAGLGLGLGLALATKLSGVLAAPMVLVAVAAATGTTSRRRFSDLTVASGVALVLLWTSYGVANRGYDAAVGRDSIERYCRGEALIVDHEMESWEPPLLAVERFSPSAAQYLTGLLGVRIQNGLGVYPSYAFGKIDSRGRWWYFPVALLIKTPLVLLLASLLAVASWRRRWPSPALAVVATTLVLYLATAMTSSYNLGIRHLLPILPILYLPAARWTATTRRRSAVVLGVLVLEAVLLAPLWMSATNTWWLGEKNPTRFVLGEVEYRQDFVALADEARRRGLERLYVLYPTVDAREIAAYPPLVAAYPPLVAAIPGDELTAGWYAVNVMVEQYVPAVARSRDKDVRGHASLVALAQRWEPFWHEVTRGEDHGYVAGTFHLYQLPADRRPGVAE